MYPSVEIALIDIILTPFNNPYRVVVYRSYVELNSTHILFYKYSSVVDTMTRITDIIIRDHAVCVFRNENIDLHAQFIDLYAQFYDHLYYEEILVESFFDHFCDQKNDRYCEEFCDFQTEFKANMVIITKKMSRADYKCRGNLEKAIMETLLLCFLLNPN